MAAADRVRRAVARRSARLVPRVGPLVPPDVLALSRSHDEWGVALAAPSPEDRRCRGNCFERTVVFELARRLLRVDFVQPAEIAVEEEAELTEVVGYCATLVFSGLTRLSAPRLTDLLNASDEVDLQDVVIQRLADDRLLDSHHATMPLSDLLAVRAGPPRGDPARRRPTRKTAMAGVTGPYGFHGYLHTRPGGDPATDLARRPPMIPLTDARLRHLGRESLAVVEAPVLIVNRNAATWIRPAREDDSTLSWGVE